MTKSKKKAVATSSSKSARAGSKANSKSASQAPKKMKSKSAVAMAPKATKAAVTKPAPKGAKASKPSKLASTLKTLLTGGKKSDKKADAKKQAAAAKAAPAAKGKKEAAPQKGKAAAAPAAPAKGAKGVAAPAPAAAVVKPGKAAKAPRLTKNDARRFAATGSRHSTADDCREVACEGLATTNGYCRMHYIKNWKKIKRKELILKEGKLNQYIEELVAKYPDKYIEAIRQDLAGDKDFAKVIYDLELDESIDDFEMEGESADSLIDNIKRDFEDEGESF